MTLSFFHPQFKLMTSAKLDSIKRAYVEMLVESMDMNMLIEIAEDSIMETFKNYEYDDIKEEVIDAVGEDVWQDIIRED